MDSKQSFWQCDLSDSRTVNTLLNRLTTRKWQTLRTILRKQSGRARGNKTPLILRNTDILDPLKICLRVGNTHIVAIVLLRFKEDEQGEPVPNNYIVTAYQKEIG